MATITLKQLTDVRACNFYRHRFELMFGESVNITPELCEKIADRFPWHWAAERLLNSSTLPDYEHRNRKAQDKMMVQWRKLVEDVQIAAISSDEYRAKCDALQNELDRARARAFAELYNSVYSD